MEEQRTEIRSICVFCGSGSGTGPEYRSAARDLGRGLAERGIRLVYGGASIGLMGILADAALEAGGNVVGVITGHLRAYEVDHRGLTETIQVVTMHERKAAMSDRADAFIALPGGYGTLEELMETLTWTQIGVHRKPVGVLNVRGFFDPLVSLIGRMAEDGFVRPEHRGLLAVETALDPLLERFRSFDPKPPAAPDEPYKPQGEA